MAFSIASTCSTLIEGCMESTGNVAWPWSELEVAVHADERTLRRAYARILKERRVDEDVEAFQRLRGAYELALNLARQQRPSDDEPLPRPSQPATSMVTSGAPASVPALASGGDTAPVIAPQTPEHEPSPAVRQPEISSPVLAARLWADFVATLGSRDAPAALAELFDGVVSLSTRDELERLALAYCLRDDVPVGLCGDIVNALGWRDDAKHLLRRDPVAVQRVLSKAAVKDNFAALCQRFPRAMAHLTDQPCGSVKAFWVLSEQRMRAEMEKLLPMLRGYYADVMRWEMDPSAIAFWSDRLEAQRRCEQRWVPVLFVGACIGALLAMAAGDQGAARLDLLFSRIGTAIVGVAAVLHVVVVSVAALLRPAPRERLQRLLGTRFGRFGWIGLWHCAIALAMAGWGIRAVESVSVLLLAAALDWSIVIVVGRDVRRYLLPAMAVAFCTGLFGYLVGVAQVLVPLAVVHGFLVAALFSTRQMSGGAPEQRAWRSAFAWAACSIAVAGLLLGGVWPPLAWGAYALLLAWCPAFTIPERFRTALFAPVHVVNLVLIVAAGSLGRFPADAPVLVFIAMGAFSVLFVLSIWSGEVQRSSPQTLISTVVVAVLAVIAGRFPVLAAVAMLLCVNICMAAHLYRVKFGRLGVARRGVQRAK
jgi:hypothetical protein